MAFTPEQEAVLIVLADQIIADQKAESDRIDRVEKTRITISSLESTQATLNKAHSDALAAAIQPLKDAIDAGQAIDAATALAQAQVVWQKSIDDSVTKKDPGAITP